MVIRVGRPSGPVPRSVTFLAGLGSFLLVAAILFWARAILIPIALAILLTFLLSPLVIRLQKVGLPKALAVIAVVGLTFVAIGGVGWLVTSQLMALAAEVPDHQRSITEKLKDVKALKEGGVFEEIGLVFARASKAADVEAAEEAAAKGADIDAGDEEYLFGLGPIPVRMIAEESVVPESVTGVLAPLIEPLAMAGLVVVLVLFMLLKREDLRNRIVTLSGRTHLAVTTKAVDEAGKRIARYLLMQFVINLTYGVAVAVGTALLGLDYAILWGVAAAVLRYIPYVGPWIAAALPIGYSLITGPDWGPPLHGWSQPAAVVALVVVLELLSNNAMEPLLYGRGVGISEVAVILSAIFWGWLWGPVGLVLATPLTACLVVAGRYVPALSIFNQILGDVPEVEPHVVYYQRLLARDEDEAEELFDEQVEQSSLLKACEAVVIPALESAKRDRMRSAIDADQQRYILESIEEHLEELPNAQAGEDEPSAPEAADADLPAIYCYAIRDEEDESACTVLATIVRDDPCRLIVLSRDRLVSEVISELKEARPLGLCLVGLHPGGITHARSLCKRFRAALPDLKIAVGRWGRALPEKHQSALRKQGATYVGHAPSETREHVLSMARLQPGGTPAVAEVGAGSAAE